MNHAIHLGLLLASIFCLSYLLSWLLAWGRIASFAAGAILVLLVNNVIVSGGVENACIEAGLIRNESKRGEEAGNDDDDEKGEGAENDDDDEKDKPVQKKKPVVDDRRINSKSRRKRELRARKGK
jgi:hypothetical protein